MSHERSVDQRVRQAAKLFGLSVRVTDASTWEVAEGIITVGTGFYPPTHDGEALTAIVCCDLWTGAILPRHTARTRLRRSLGSEHPHLEGFLSTVDRIQAAGELIASFPGFYTGLQRFFAEHLGGNLRSVPAPEQFLAALTVTMLSPDTRLRLTAEVRQAIEQIDVEMLRLAITPMDPADPARTLRRILALTLPVMERFTVPQGRGLTHEGEGSGEGMGTEEQLDIGFSGGDEPGSQDTESGEAQQATSSDDDPARKGSGPETAEGADLFEAKQAGEVGTVLATPLPGDGAEALAVPEDALAAEQGQVRTRDETGGETLHPGGAANTQAGLNQYLARVGAHADTIERLAEVWLALSADRLTHHSRDTRTPFPDGDQILPEALPRVIAQARAGVAAPEAYTRRHHYVRERENTGNTDVVFLIDRSGSMHHAATAAADAAAVMMEALGQVMKDLEWELQQYGLDERAGIRTSLIVFDAQVEVIKPLAALMSDDARVQLFQEVLRTGGGTNDAAALDEAAGQLGLTSVDTAGVSRTGERKRVVIVVSDGGSSDLAAAEASLRFLRSRGVTVYGIGVGPGHMATRYAPDGRNIHDAHDMVNVFEELLTTEMGWLAP